MQVTLVQCSPRLMGEELWKCQVFLSGIYSTKEGRENVEGDKWSDRPRSHRTDEDVEKVRNLVHFYSRPSLLCRNIEAVTSRGLKSGSRIGFSTMTMSQFTRRSSSSCVWPKNQLLNWNRPTLFRWFGSEWLLAVSINEIFHEGIKISIYWRHEKKKKREYGTENCSTVGVPKLFWTVAATTGLSV
jgi:hypothetical protein